MPLDIAILDENFVIVRLLALDSKVHGVLFKKIVTIEEYPFLGQAKKESEDLVFTPNDLPEFKAEVIRLEKYLADDTMMSAEVKANCMKFVVSLGEMCDKAMEMNKSLDFIAGE